jgi:hypothetical protein
MPAANKQLQRTVIRHRGDGASAPFHYALAARWWADRAAAELRRWASGSPLANPSVSGGLKISSFRGALMFQCG